MADHDDEAYLHPSAARRCRFVIESACVGALGFCVRLLPRGLATGLGACLGTLAYLVLPDRRVAMANLDLVLGDAVPRSRKKQLARQTFQRLGRVVLGLFWSPRLTVEQVKEAIDVAALSATLQSLHSRGKGVVLVTAHYGDWELLCHATAMAGFPVMMVTEPLTNRRLQAVFDHLRSCKGNRTIPPKYALLKLFRGLRRGERVAVMCDVNGRRGRGGVWVNFFGLPVYNGVAMAELAIRTESAIVFAAAIPQADGRAVVQVWPTIEPSANPADHHAAVVDLTQRIADYHAELLKRDPAPWLWTYKRWKRKRTLDAKGYPFYASFKRVE